MQPYQQRTRRRTAGNRFIVAVVKESSRRLKLEQWSSQLAGHQNHLGGKKEGKGMEGKNGRGEGGMGGRRTMRGERRGEEIQKLEATSDMLGQNLWHGTWRFNSFRSSLGDSSELVRLGNL